MSSSNQHTKVNKGLGVEQYRNQIFVPEVVAQNQIFFSINTGILVKIDQRE